MDTVDIVGMLPLLTYVVLAVTEKVWPAREFPNPFHGPRRGLIQRKPSTVRRAWNRGIMEVFLQETHHERSKGSRHPERRAHSHR